MWERSSDSEEDTRRSKSPLVVVKPSTTHQAIVSNHDGLNHNIATCQVIEHYLDSGRGVVRRCGFIARFANKGSERRSPSATYLFG